MDNMRYLGKALPDLTDKELIEAAKEHEMSIARGIPAFDLNRFGPRLIRELCYRLAQTERVMDA